MRFLFIMDTNTHKHIFALVRGHLFWVIIMYVNCECLSVMLIM